MGAVSGGASALGKAALTGTLKTGVGTGVKLESKVERAVVGAMGASKGAVVGVAQAGRDGEGLGTGAANGAVKGLTGVDPQAAIDGVETAIEAVGRVADLAGEFTNGESEAAAAPRETDPQP